MPLTELEQVKAGLRGEVRTHLRALTPEQKRDRSRELRCLLERQKMWQAAQAILIFAPLPDEPDLWPLAGDALTAGKTLTLPRFSSGAGEYTAARVVDLEKDLLAGRFGIREPAGHCADFPLNRLDLALVPGVGFDLYGRRLGRGKGYYDRLLRNVQATKCGIAFEEQILHEIPFGPHDIHLNCILTPTRLIVV